MPRRSGDNQYWDEYWKYKKGELKRGVRVRNVITKKTGVVTGKLRLDPYFVHVKVDGKEGRPIRERFVTWYLPNVGLYKPEMDKVYRPRLTFSIKRLVSGTVVRNTRTGSKGIVCDDHPGPLYVQVVMIRQTKRDKGPRLHWGPWYLEHIKILRR